MSTFDLASPREPAGQFKIGVPYLIFASKAIADSTQAIDG